MHLREIKDDPQAQLDSVGATLRAARLNRGVDTEQVAAVLKMRKDHVEAIEDNDFARLPGRTYAIGFVRAYARFLGLDAEVIVQRFKEESAGREHDRTVELVFPDAPEEARNGSGSLLLVAILITAAIAGAYYVSMPQRQAATTAAPAAPDAAAVVVNEVPRPLYDGPQAPDEPVAPAASATDGTAVPATGPDAAPQAAAASTAQTPATPAAATAPATPAGDAERVFGSENVGSRIVFRATAPSYVLVKEPGPNGKVTLFERTLNSGDSYRAPNRAGVTLITGNAGGLDVEIDGKKLGTLGKSGETLRNVPVDASYFVERLATTSATPAQTAPKPTPAKPKPASTAASTPTAPRKPAATPPAPAPTPSETPVPATGQ